MTDADAYPTDIDYVPGFYAQQGVVRLAHLADLQGFAAAPLDRPFRYLDLGCGHGVTALLLAAVLPHGEFHGTDINGSFVQRAQATAERYGVGNVRYHRLSFAELLEAPLGPFDYITLHGVYGWVGPAPRREIRKVLQRGLAPGGIAMVSYNCRPGSADLVELRRLWLTLADRLQGERDARIRQALALLQRFEQQRSRLFVELPELVPLLRKYAAETDLNTIVHELFAEDFHVPAVEEVAHAMAEAGLQFVGDVEPPLSLLELALPPALAARFGGGADRLLQCMLADFQANRRFRGDLYAQPFPDSRPAPRLSYGPTGDGKPFTGELDFLAGHWQAGSATRHVAAALTAQPRTLASLRLMPELTAVPPDELKRILGTLVGTERFAPMLHEGADAVPPHIRAAADRFNRHVAGDVLAGRPTVPLVSPLTCAAISLDFLELLLVAAQLLVGPQAAMACLIDRLSAPGARLTIAGRPLSDPDELRRELAAAHARFDAERLPRLRALAVL